MEAKQINDKIFEVIPKGNKEKDLLAPWFKLSKNFNMDTDLSSIFSRYIVFYLNVITSGDENGFISSSTIHSIGSDIGMNTKIIEASLKELVRLNMVFKIKNGSYQVNPLHINKKQNVKDSNSIIRNVQNNQTIMNNPVFNVSPSASLLQQLLAKGKEMNDLNQL